MLLYLDIDSRRILSTPTRAISRLELKRRDNDTLEILFLREGIVQELPGTTARVGIKTENEYASEFLAVTTLAQTGTGTSTVYIGEINLNTTAMAAAFAEEPATLAAMFEVEWTSGTALSSSRTLPVTIFNDVIRGDEGEPAELPVFYTAETSDFLATQAQAETGTDNATWMTPLRTAQAIAALAATDWDSVTGKPTEFPPAAHAHELADVTGLEAALLGKAATTHTHTQSDITGLEAALLGKAATTHTHPLSDLTASGATTGQVPTFNGTAWVPQDASGGVTSYLDLTNVPSTFPPSTHTHVVSDVTGLQTALDGKQSAGSYAAATHTHTISDVTGLETALDGKQAAGAYLTATGGITTIAVVASMPATPDANTLYVVTT
jgi:hypothetical protein